MNKQNINNLTRSIVVILSYFAYTRSLFTIFEAFNIENLYDSWTFSFISDVIYFIIIVFLYRNTFIEDFKDLKNGFAKKYLYGLKWLLIALIFQFVIVGIIRQFIPGLIGNEAAIKNLPILYMIFKTMIFSIIVEELVFKKSVRDVVSNNKLFVIVSSLFYGVMNVAYVDLGSSIEFLIILPYIVSSAIMGILYIKTNNIMLIMLVKFTYNILPLTAALLGLIK